MSKLLHILVALYFLISSSIASSSILTYNFHAQQVSWSGLGSPPFNMPAVSDINGSITIDNSKSGTDAFESIFIQTGKKAWTDAMLYRNQSNFNPLFSNFANFDSSGDLTEFGFNLVDNNSYAYFKTYYPTFGTNNPVNIYENNIGSATCGGNCLSFSLNTVPLPSAIWLFGSVFSAFSLLRGCRQKQITY